MRRVLGRVLLVAIAFAAVLYAADYAVVMYRVARKTPGPFGSVEIHPYYAIKQKNKEVEFDFLDPVNQDCVHSLFPHFGDAPCWYLERNRQQRTDI
jgi:hypothetical protein